jgi:hypothetical protein
MSYKGVGVTKLSRFTILISFLTGIIFTSMNTFAGSVSLAWDPSPDAGVVGYKVYYGGVTGTYTNSAAVGNVTNATFTGLVNGTTYYFAASAIDASGFESDFSNETISIIPLLANQPPTLAVISSVTLAEDASAQTVSLSGISSGATNETQTLTVTASSSNAALIPNPTVTYTSPNAAGSLAFTPVSNANGSAVVTVTVNDGGPSNNIVTRTFTVTVNAVNDAPAIAAISNVSLAEDAGAQTVSLAGISTGAANESQTLAITATSSNPSLIPNPTVTYTSPNATGSLAIIPVANSSGTATITVTVNDGGAANNTATQTFTVNVSNVNDAPTLNTLANITINEGAAQSVSLAGISTGSTNETQTLTITATSSSTSLIPNPTVTYTSPNATGSLNVSALSGVSGSATITVTVNDGGAANNTTTRSFTATINRLPTIAAITGSTNLVNTTIAAVPFTISDTETAAGSLTLTASSSNTSLVQNSGIVLSGSGANRTATITPVANATGTTTITLTVNDGSATSTRSFAITVVPKPTAPGNLHVAQALP